MVDVSDAVGILGYLFLGNPTDLVPLCRPQSLVKGLPDTGHTACWRFLEEQGNVVVPCGEATCAGQDGAYATGCPADGRFSDNGDGTVTDICTGLEWQKEPADVNGDGLFTYPDDAPLWCNALAYCEGLSLAGHDDWRLPNVRELQSIVDYGRLEPAIDPAFGVPPGVGLLYWSSTPYTGHGAPWHVDFGYGSVGLGGQGNGLIRAVRGGS
jgi:hypothetical protein